MACVWTFEQMPGDTTAFLINEYNEYNELTQLKEFKLYDRYHRHWFEVKDGIMTVGYDLDDGKVIKLYHGKLDGSEGDITLEYLTIKQENYPDQDNHTVTGRAHGDMRRIVAQLNFRAKDLWEEEDLITLVCDHEEGTTHRNGKLLTIGFKTDDCVLSAYANYPLQCVIQLPDGEYLLDQQWGESFVIYRRGEVKDSVVQPVETLILPQGHNVLRLLMEIEDD